MIKIKVQLFGGRGIGSTRIRIVRGFSTKLHPGGQGKHIIGHNNYKEGKSYLTISMSDAQKLINKYAGHKKNRLITPNKEKVNFRKLIGYWFDEETQRYCATSWGTIEYSKHGARIIPRKPDKY